jgi:NADH dehydrogenase
MIALTGSAGFLGTELLEQIRQHFAGERIRVLVHRTGSPPISGIEVCHGSLHDPASLAPFVHGARTVVHCGAVIDARRHDDYEKTNVDGTRNLLEASRGAGVGSFVFVSSLDVTLPIQTPYSESKAEAEKLVKASGSAYLIVRPSMIFGDDGDSPAVNQLKRLAGSLGVLPLFGDRFVLQPVHVGDVASTICEQMKLGAHDRVISVVGPETLSQKELYRRVLARSGSRAVIVAVPRWLVRALNAFFESLRLRQRFMTRRILALYQEKVFSGDPSAVVTGRSRFPGGRSQA